MTLYLPCVSPSWNMPFYVIKGLQYEYGFCGYNLFLLLPLRSCLLLSMPLSSLEKRQVVSVWCGITNHEAVLDIEFIVISFFRFFSKVYVEEMERHHFSSCQFPPLFWRRDWGGFHKENWKKTNLWWISLGISMPSPLDSTIFDFYVYEHCTVSLNTNYAQKQVGK